MTKLAVMVSGTGSILEAMIAAGLDITLVVADRPCRGLVIARQAGLATQLISRTDFGRPIDRAAYTAAVADTLAAHGIGLVAMAGFMTILSESIFERFPGKILNTHPSLLPAFKGDHAVQDALDYGVKLTGCTIHIATPELDNGPILAQASVPVNVGDDATTIQERIKQVERQLYPALIKELIAKETLV